MDFAKDINNNTRRWKTELIQDVVRSLRSKKADIKDEVERALEAGEKVDVPRYMRWINMGAEVAALEVILMTRRHQMMSRKLRNSYFMLAKRNRQEAAETCRGIRVWMNAPEGQQIPERYRMIFADPSKVSWC
jgi:hypothetical protein